MDRRAFDDRKRIGTVKAAVSMYGERILEGHSLLKNSQKDLPEFPFKAKEFLIAKKDGARFKESKKVAEFEKKQAESELSMTRKTLKSPASQLEESNSKAKARIKDVEILKKKSIEKDLDVESSESYHKYAEMMRELDLVKQELSRLKLDVASVMKEKSRAEKEIEGSNSKLLSNLKYVDEFRSEIEVMNEEQVLAELARIEALKELGEIQAQREKEGSEFSDEIQKHRHKMKVFEEEIDSSKEFEAKLDVTLTDVGNLQNELKVVKEIEKKVPRNDSLKHSGSGSSFRRTDKEEDLPSLSIITEELDAANKELAAIKEEGFQFMCSMDIIRNELKHVTEETAELKKKEQKADSIVQNLKSKLLRAKSKLETAAAEEEKAKSIVTNLSITLDQLKNETEVAKKEKELISVETSNIKAEIPKTETEIDTTEKKLQAAMLELEAVEASEASALENLQNLIENAMRTRASASQQTSTITISKFENDYLTGRAVGAEEIADKKVAAAQAWVEALKASEKEILMKLEMAHREIRETRVEEEQHVCRIERSLSAKRVVEREIRNWKQAEQRNSSQGETRRRQTSRKSMKSSTNSTPRTSMKGNGNWTPSKRGQVRNSSSPAIRTTPGSTSFVIRKKKKVMPDLARFFSGKKIGKNKL